MRGSRLTFLIAPILIACGALADILLSKTIAQQGMVTPLYRLGPGDRLTIKLFQMNSFDSSVTVLPDGTISLPRVGSLRIWGLGVEETRTLITKAYARILRRPVVYVDLISTRPIRVTVSGEVQRPGLYTLGLQEANQLSNSGGGGEATTIASQGWPTLVEAIQKAGGLTARGDLRQVQLIRPVGSNGAIQTKVINYWEALHTGRPVANPLVYDGDGIRIPVAEKHNEGELITIASSSFSPASITVNVVGEVDRPGPQQIKANSPLSQAILSAGGLSRRAKRNEVELVRIQPNGSIERKQFAYQPGAALGATTNPPLRDGDVVIVDRHLWAKTTDSLKSAVEPLGPVLNAASVFRLLGVPF